MMRRRRKKIKRKRRKVKWIKNNRMVWKNRKMYKRYLNKQECSIKGAINNNRKLPRIGYKY